MKRRPEGSAWLTRRWIWPALGNNCSYGLWREVLTPPHCASRVLPVHILWTPGCVRTPTALGEASAGQGPRQHSEVPGSVWGASFCFLPPAGPSRAGSREWGRECWGGDVDRPSGLCWEGHLAGPSALEGPLVRLFWDRGCSRSCWVWLRVVVLL